MATGSNESIHH